MEESVQNDTVASVAVSQESPVEEKGKKMGVYVLIVLLVFSLLGLTYFILKDNGVNLLENVIGDRDNKQEDVTGDNNVEDSDTEECTVCTNEARVDNDGWGLFSLPQYGFSVEIPTYRMMQSLTGTSGTQDIYSYWDVKHADYAPQDFNLSWQGKIHTAELAHNVLISFFPSELPDGFGCGQGCVKEHNFRVYIFDREKESWSKITDRYNNALQKEADQNSITFENEETEKWGKDVLYYSIQGGAYFEGYVVANDSYVFNILYYIDSASSESKQIALKVLDSMKFE